MDITKERAIETGIHVLIQTASIDAVVDDNPQVAIIENGNCKIMNYDENNSKFSIVTPELFFTKEKVEGIADKQTAVFELLLDDSEELKKEFLDLLDKYKNRSKAKL